jgi:hypothetical protein
MFDNEEVRILCQNENGPCPLLAICNVLILRGKMRLPSNTSIVTFDDLVHLIADELLSRQISPVEQQTELATQRIDSVISLLPTLQFGLDINIHYDKITGFEYTRELDAFDVLGVPLYHGWIVDPQDVRASSVVLKYKSYNQLMFKLVEAKAMSPTDETSNAELLKEGNIIQTFLDDTASQLTYYGLLQLHSNISEGSLGVFFRNNHFATMHKRNGNLYLLVTDLGYADEPAAAWEVLDEIDGYVTVHIHTLYLL